jgi:cytochrome c556
MEKTAEALRAEIASLQENVTKFRRLAEERRAADQILIADKLIEVAADFEAKAAELQRLLAGDRTITD